MTVVTRFAPSPTGYLHIGGGRTALFNYLFARRHGGKFLLRIEDTDRARSTEPAVKAILDGLTWLGIEWDGEPISQFERRERHAEVARQLLAEGKAYYCFATPEELEAMRERQKAEGRPVRYDGRWRDRDPAEGPADVKPVIRLKAPQTGQTVLKDRVQGEVTVGNEQLDDMVLLRGDGTPTYMLAVVVDDHDMGVTHVIRGDDHLTNTFRQIQIYDAMGWAKPDFAHIPLIHGPDGAKLSKRHGALAIDAYAEMGYLPEAMRNYLLRLGWAHGDAEIITDEEAKAWFDLEGIGRSPSRLDFAKLAFVNQHWLKAADNGRLLGLVAPRLEAALGRPLSDTDRDRLLRALDGLKPRAKGLVELADSAIFYCQARPLPLTPKAAALLDDDAKAMLRALAADFAGLGEWSAAAIEAAARAHAEAGGLKLGRVAQPLRAALTGSDVSPPVFEVAEILGRDESLGRLADAAGAA
ncbi:MAG TPA: glutamate--tRNA ligase [Alphaproteobacteria bacterium]|nr:glutamate--tRNA ligase [Alphaproteobacteria bacterium]